MAGLILGWAGWGLFSTHNTGSLSDQEFNDTAENSTVELEELYPHVLKPRSTLFSALRELSVSPITIHHIVEASKPVYNLTKLRSGTRFQLLRENEPSADIVGIKFKFSPVDMLEIRRIDGAWKAQEIKEPVSIKVVTFSGVVTSSLWESAERASMDPNLISELAEIFAWQVDFAREVRVNDRWRLSVERKFAKGQPIGWGSILAAEYENAGNLNQAVLFRLSGEDKGYFSPDGASLKKMFLKSPIRYGRISSRFQRRRFHPILQVHRPHLGVDYAAPKGTPIRSVGDGVITFAGWSGGGGKVIKIRHNSVYQTAYKHLNGYAPGIRNGSRVKQGQVIGYVGSTGLSTAPHLHFEFFQAGRYVDPLGKKFPSADPVPKILMGQFEVESVSLLQSLPPWELLEASLRQAASENTEAAN